MAERLTMTSGKGGVAFTFDLDITCRPSEAQKILKLAEKLKHYEDLEEQGRLIELPCKIGDTVYVVEDWGYRKELKEREIGVITLKGINDFSKEFWEDVYGGILGNFSDIGKTVFLTKVEAEAALKELRGEQTRQHQNGYI